MLNGPGDKHRIGKNESKNEEHQVEKLSVHVGTSC
jgi:hypothetical protein